MWFIRVLAIMVACFAVPVTAMASMNSDPSWPKLPSVEVQRVEGEHPTSDEIVVEILKRIAAANHAAAQKAAAEELADRQREQALQLELERKRQTVFKSSPDWDYWFYRELLEDGMTDEERNFMRDRAFDAESAKRAWHDVYNHRRLNRVYADAGPLKTLAAFAAVAVTDGVLLVVACIIGVVSLRWWWMALRLGALAGAGMWVLLKHAAPWSTWVGLALVAHVIAAALAAAGAFALKRATLRIATASRVSAGERA